MFKFCPEHGQRLNSHIFTDYWCTLHECPVSTCPGYIHVGDPQWISPLLRLESGVLRAVKSASPRTLDVAFDRIKRIDYKTVSIVDFESTILGCFKHPGEQ